VAGDFKGNEYHADLESIRTEQIPLQRNDDKGASFHSKMMRTYKRKYLL